MPPEPLADRLGRTRDRVAAACRRSGREPDAVRIVAITKGHPAATLEAALAAGLKDVGENRVREALEKFDAAREPLAAAGVRRHMVGHLQRNKTREAVQAFDWIQSVDSLRLARALSDRRPDDRAIQALVQVNAAGEGQKHGFDPEGALDRALEIEALPGLAVRGVMAMAPWTEDEAVLRSTFQEARRLFEVLRERSRRGDGIDTLSMGMSGDYVLAIEEGSTMVRLGTVLFGERGE